MVHQDEGPFRRSVSRKTTRQRGTGILAKRRGLGLTLLLIDFEIFLAKGTVSVWLPLLLQATLLLAFLPLPSRCAWSSVWQPCLVRSFFSRASVGIFNGMPISDAIAPSFPRISCCWAGWP